MSSERKRAGVFGPDSDRLINIWYTRFRIGYSITSVLGKFWRKLSVLWGVELLKSRRGECYSISRLEYKCALPTSTGLVPYPTFTSSYSSCHGVLLPYCIPCGICSSCLWDCECSLDSFAVKWSVADAFCSRHTGQALALHTIKAASSLQVGAHFFFLCCISVLSQFMALYLYQTSRTHLLVWSPTLPDLARGPGLSDGLPSLQMAPTHQPQPSILRASSSG
jgi:hypothetical protein